MLRLTTAVDIELLAQDIRRFVHKQQINIKEQAFPHLWQLKAIETERIIETFGDTFRWTPSLAFAVSQRALVSPSYVFQH